MKIYVAVKTCLVAVTVVFGLLLGGCGGLETRTNLISVGMSKQEVIAVMGTPNATRATQGVEYLTYILYTHWLREAHHKIEYFVQLRNGKVTAYGRPGDFDSQKIPESTININKTVKEIE